MLSFRNRTGRRALNSSTSGSPGARTPNPPSSQFVPLMASSFLHSSLWRSDYRYDLLSELHVRMFEAQRLMDDVSRFLTDSDKISNPSLNHSLCLRARSTPIICPHSIELTTPVRRRRINRIHVCQIHDVAARRPRSRVTSSRHLCLVKGTKE